MLGERLTQVDAGGLISRARNGQHDGSSGYDCHLVKDCCVGVLKLRMQGRSRGTTAWTGIAPAMCSLAVNNDDSVRQSRLHPCWDSRLHDIQNSSIDNLGPMGDCEHTVTSRRPCVCAGLGLIPKALPVNICH